ncbi:MAG: class I SAM-dependent methyltransferase [Longimonas sp.]|uniref:class I SAM-dependent methyltransferase n=1 Tax=Longimonas sp. TaxID=2039626 RepID=UPI003975D4A8
MHGSTTSQPRAPALTNAFCRTDASSKRSPLNSILRLEGYLTLPFHVLFVGYDGPDDCMSLPALTTVAHQWIATHLTPGQHAVDATAGNGHDTVFLAQQVGAQGRVTAFDVQVPACAATRRRCAQAEVSDRVTVVHAGHETMRDHVEAPIHAAMFNLGYLPRHDHTRITRPDTTVAALNAACELMTGGGLLTVLAYRGHEGGPEEAQHVQDWIDARIDTLRILQSRLYSANPDAPLLWGIQVPAA